MFDQLWQIYFTIISWYHIAFNVCAAVGFATIVNQICPLLPTGSTRFIEGLKNAIEIVDYLLGLIEGPV